MTYAIDGMIAWVEGANLSNADSTAKVNFCQGKRKSLMQGMRAAAPDRSEERFLTAQADRFAGAKRKEKASACSVRNDGCASRAAIWEIGRHG